MTWKSHPWSSLKDLRGALQVQSVSSWQLSELESSHSHPQHLFPASITLGRGGLYTLQTSAFPNLWPLFPWVSWVYLLPAGGDVSILSLWLHSSALPLSHITSRDSWQWEERIMWEEAGSLVSHKSTAFPKHGIDLPLSFSCPRWEPTLVVGGLVPRVVHPIDSSEGSTHRMWYL